MTDEERNAIRREAHALFKSLKNEENRNSYVGFSHADAIQLVAGAMPVIVQQVQLDSLRKELGQPIGDLKRALAASSSVSSPA